MGKSVAGQVVSAAFPFSDLTTGKRRPALVVAVADFDDIILCQITSKTYTATRPVKLVAADFADGGLPIDSYIRPDKLFTADASIAEKVYGTVSDKKLAEVHAEIRTLFTHHN